MVLMLAGTSISDVWDARLTIEPAAVRRLAENATDEQLGLLDRELDGSRDTAPLQFLGSAQREDQILDLLY
ncbi:hypothetical protein JDM601_3809 [Mycolicibacter sinensis]|uniref:GntR C-terminal domain-containing protein n=2 Tax=Mycolicibacter sinensis (strain JDM601) TaxID=875328 RepID=F5YRL8_MYCSD|nr:hypothetical protein JDM601_3809 [Mycolicibacter sinensis]